MNERREHLPSPVKKHILWSSPLKGMEQPVRSFKSFIQTVPPNPSSEDEKPLPPTPSTPTGPTSPSWPHDLASLERTSSVTSWRAPAEWKWEIPIPPSQPFQSTSIFAARKYSPLLPEPSTPRSEMSLDLSLRPFEQSHFQQPQLLPIQESSNGRPEPPPRNPSRTLLHRTSSSEDESEMSTPSIRYGLPSSLPGSGTYAAYPAALRPQNKSPQSSTNAKAFASLGIDPPGNTESARDNRATSPSSMEGDDDAPANLSLRGKQLRPLNRGSPIVDNGLENNELTAKMRQLSFSKDYHDVLADQYHELHTQQPKVPFKKQMQKRDQKTTTSWVPYHLKAGQNRHVTKSQLHPRSASDSAVPRRKQIPESEVDRLLGKDIRLPSFLAHTRGLRPVKRRAKTAEAGHHIESSSQPTLPLELRTPLLRLPGGFVLVRQKSSEAPQSQAASSQEVWPPAEIARQRSNTTSPVSVSDTSQGRSSSYSQHWQVLVAPTVATNKRQRNSLGSPSSLYSRSSTSSPPTSPLAQEISLPRTPPPIPPHGARRPKRPFVSSPLPRHSEENIQRKPVESKDDHDNHMQRVLSKARGARDAWRRHQRELRHDKLKQSIKVLGPTDPAVVAGYVRREGRRLENGEADSGRVPGYLVSGPV
ncbi:uncharacterized protein K460DRAFT_207769 [Cucurbitaria berberidis CBS 394.84]|uniref:Uncharacterized protein n=1 Tax=Cucurbitaria berberidis CBS 394.84 TaxID=1168544 RepID=A0A9P4G7D7_9PLEO|nr:uncharacterized protein K460DRAFT_207769 [Cucurbitaria berberidis CBS 394.84]KAF1840406.1 hypothetical protein K460DRAFT_207769 [Cucurbitaria berberidis CBS 394.84]